jgi:BlaI family transcriptional regulator, penicillinase repressor
MDAGLTELQLAILHVLWQRGEGTVVDVQKALAERDLAHATVATLLRRLESKGVIHHRTEGRQYVYTPLVSQDEVRRSVVAEFAERAADLLEGDFPQVVDHLLRIRDVDVDELSRIKALIEEKETELKRHHRE